MVVLLQGRDDVADSDTKSIEQPRIDRDIHLFMDTPHHCGTAHARNGGKRGLDNVLRQIGEFGYRPRLAAEGQRHDGGRRWIIP